MILPAVNVDDNAPQGCDEDRETYIKEDDDIAVLPDTVTKLDTVCGSKVYLVGTNHLSGQSPCDVAQTIAAVQPNTVVVEACSLRKADLFQKPEVHKTNTFSAVSTFGIGGGLMYMVMTKISMYGEQKVGRIAGQEFRRAVDEAEKIPGCRVVLGDRPINITIMRALSTLSVRHVFRTLSALRSKDIFDNKTAIDEVTSDHRLLMKSQSRFETTCPNLHRVFVKERDAYLAFSLKTAAQHIPHSGSLGTTPAVVVGVVGMGHVPGIISNWDQMQYDVKEIIRIPERKWHSRVLRYCVLIGVLATLYYKVKIPADV